MDYEKILESLKICSEVGTSCEGCSGRGERHCIANLTKAAAIAIETLLHALDMAKRERDVVTKRMIELEQEVCRLKSRLAAYEDTGLEPEEIADAVTAAKLMARSKILSCFGVDADHIRELVKAEKDGRLAVLPCGTDVELIRDGYAFKADHWNHTLTAFRDEPKNKSGKQIALFSTKEAEAAMKGGDSPENRTD